LGQELLGNSPDRLQFAGKERDQETGTAGWQPFDYFGARYYQSQTGRFTSPDPLMTLEENLFDPQRWNRYSYVRNNPLRYTDPDGRTLVKLGITLAKIVYKGGDVYSTVEGIVESAKTIADSQSTWTERGIAGAQLAGELTGVSDLLKGAKTVVNAVDNGIDVTRGVKRGGESVASREGRRVHKENAYGNALGDGYVLDERLPSGRRPDAVNRAKKEVRELKPDNPRAIRKGRAQVERYRKELEELFGGNWTAFVDVYIPDWD
jgi:RHS repeat-associated protein